MAVLDPIKPTILSAGPSPTSTADFAAKLGLRPEQRSLGMITCDIDDSLYVALDEATKKAEVEVVYAHSFYAGSGARLRPAVGGDHRHPRRARSGGGPRRA
jgi:ethanolamine utilization protein EutL